MGATSHRPAMGYVALMLIGSRARRHGAPARKTLHRVMTLAALAVALGALSGCAVVKPWERGRLAERHMQIPPTKGEAYLDQHVATSKESAAGGTSLEGGGCGCN